MLVESRRYADVRTLRETRSHERQRPRKKPQKHVDHISEKGYVSDFHHCMVHQSTAQQKCDENSGCQSRSRQRVGQAETPLARAPLPPLGLSLGMRAACLQRLEAKRARKFRSLAATLNHMNMSRSDVRNVTKNMRQTGEHLAGELEHIGAGKCVSGVTKVTGEMPAWVTS